MAAGKWNVTVEQGATWIRTITVKDDGVGRDLTGYSIRMQVRQRPESNEVFLSLATGGNGITITDAENGIFQLSLTATQTAALTAVGGYYYDLELEDASGHVTRLLEGRFAVSLEVTRP